MFILNFSIKVPAGENAHISEYGHIVMNFQQTEKMYFKNKTKEKTTYRCKTNHFFRYT